MAEQNLVLVVAAYGDDTAAAAADFEALKELGDVAIVAAVVLDRDDAGVVHVKEHGGGLVGGGAAVGAVGGFVVGLFAPPLLAVTVIGAVVGAGVGALVKRHEEKTIGLDAQEWLPNGASAIVAIVDDEYLDRVDHAIAKASKKVDKAIDKGDAEAVAKALDEGGEKIVKALES